MAMEFRLTFDCADPAVLAPVWAASAYELEGHYHVVMQDPDGNEFCVR